MLQPEEAKIKVEALGENSSRVIVGPLPQGYGHTLGNSLRRILLSSLSGAALTQVTYAGVPHKFTTIPGVKEDVLEINLRLKEVRLRLNSENPVVVSIQATGPGTLKAGDIKTSADVEIINKDLVLATLADKKTKIEAELVVEKGVGYLPVEERERSRVGTLLLDAIFTPVTNVSYQVDPARVGQVTNLDSLVLEITTDGSMTPKEAFMKASTILERYADRLANGEEEIKSGELASEVGEDALPEEMLNTFLEELDLPTRVVNALQKAGIKTVGDLLSRKQTDLLKVKNLGEKSLKEIDKILAKEGFR